MTLAREEGAASWSTAAHGKLQKLDGAGSKRQSNRFQPDDAAPAKRQAEGFRKRENGPLGGVFYYDARSCYPQAGRPSGLFQASSRAFGSATDAFEHELERGSPRTTPSAI